MELWLLYLVHGVLNQAQFLVGELDVVARPVLASLLILQLPTSVGLFSLMLMSSSYIVAQPSSPFY